MPLGGRSSSSPLEPSSTRRHGARSAKSERSWSSARAKEQLADLGHPQLAAQVRQVSLRSDALGYDVTAPRTIGNGRLFEVKSSIHAGPDITFYLSRNEITTGCKYPDDWFLICCRVNDVAARTGEILGWCGPGALEPHSPSDRGAGAWQSVQITLSETELAPGLPY